MKTLLILTAIFASLQLNAQNYLIAFTGSGATKNVQTVKVENISTGESVILNGTDVLTLKGGTITGIDDKTFKSGMQIYPNPMIDNATIEVYPPVSGNASISIFDISGRKLIQKSYYLENTLQQFRLFGAGKGLYIINIKGANYQFTDKLICNSENGLISIEQIGQGQKKSISSGIDLRYTPGDKLKFIGTSGSYELTKTDIINKDKTVNFNFTVCKDASNNSYSTVEIDNRIWMGENLKTTKYNDGTNIPLFTMPNIPAYSWFNNDSATYAATYGAYYNWWAVNTGKLCPVDWHVPTETEWVDLTTYLGGESVAGGKLKETGLTHWMTPNVGATNETGFTALPGSMRTKYGEFVVENIGWNAFFWSSTPYKDFAWMRHLGSFRSDLTIYGYERQISMSVRCIKD
jgi:uncharacterized protein (TIGR02145 family)